MKEEDNKKKEEEGGTINIVEREGIQEGGGKIIKLWRRENDKIVEEGIKTLRRENMDDPRSEPQALHEQLFSGTICRLLLSLANTAL